MPSPFTFPPAVHLGLFLQVLANACCALSCRQLCFCVERFLLWSGGRTCISLVTGGAEPHPVTVGETV